MVMDDLPIDSKTKDLLHRDIFVRNVSSVIINYAKYNSDCLVIGLEGDWGSGKTSTYNLIKNELEERNKEKAVNIASIEEFNSWMVLTKESLLAEFLNRVTEIVERLPGFDKGGEYIKSIPQNIKLYLESVLKNCNTSLSLKVDGCGLSIGPNWQRIFSKSIVQQKEEIKRKLDECLQGNRIVIFIDDIDRLDDDEICLIMQLIKNIADFNNVIYILAYDRDVIEKALNNKNKGNGKNFLDKIVQMPIRLPRISEYDIRSYFRKEYECILSECEYVMNEKRFSYIFKGGVSRYLISLRSCKRFFNTFYVRWLASCEFCDPVDLLGIVCLEVFEPEVFEYVYRKCSSFYIADKEIGIALVNSNNKKIMMDITDNVAHTDIEAVNKILKSLFSRFDEGNEQATLVSAKEQVNLIREKDNFYKYFCWRVNEDDLLLAEVEKAFYDGDGKSLPSALAEWEKNGKLINALEKLYAIVQDAQDKDLVIRYSVVFHGISALNDIGKYNKSYKCIALCMYILKKIYEIGYKERMSRDILIGIYDDKKISLDLLYAFMDWIGRGHRWGDGNDSIGEAAVDENTFEECQERYLNRAQSGFDDGNIFNQKFLPEILNKLFLKCPDVLAEKLKKLSIENLLMVIECALWKGSYGLTVKKWLWNMIPHNMYTEECKEFIFRGDGYSDMMRNATLYLARENNITSVFDGSNRIVCEEIEFYYYTLLKEK